MGLGRLGGCVAGVVGDAVSRLHRVSGGLLHRGGRVTDLRPVLRIGRRDGVSQQVAEGIHGRMHL